MKQSRSERKRFLASPSYRKQHWNWSSNSAFGYTNNRSIWVGKVSREEAMKAFIESGMEIRRDDIELGKKLERERIINLLDRCLYWSYDIGIADKESRRQVDVEQLIYLIKGEQK